MKKHLGRIVPVLALLFAQALVCHGQLDRIHWLPPVMTDTTNVSAGNADNHYVVITTPSTSAVPFTIKDGTGTIIQSGTVSNASPVNFQIANNVGNNVVPTVAGTSDHHVGIEQINQVTTEGIVVEADEPVYVNIRQRSGSQGASMTSKGCAAIGTEFRVGTMRARLGTSQSYRNDFFSIMATEDNTVVTIDEIKPGMIFTGRTDTSPITVTLQKWESYTVAINHPDYPGTADVNDIDGTRVTSTKPVTMVSGSYLGSPLSTNARDAGFDQPGPVARAGTQYVLLKGAGASTSILESPQVIATKPNTNVFINGALTPVNPTPLQPGDYLYLDNQWSANGTMYITSNEPVVVHQTTGGSNSSATPGFSYIPPLNLSVTGVVDNIADVNQIGPATLRVVTTTGATVSVNGGAPLTGALAIAGTTDFVAYTVPNVTGDIAVNSTGPVAVSVLNFQNPVGAAGYFSGFPAFSAQIEVVSTEDCLPGLELRAVDPSGALILQFEWFNGDGTPTGVTGPNFTPTAPGDYFVRSFLAPNAPCTVEDSAMFTVENCPVSDVSIEKSIPQDPVGPGSVVTVSLTVTNGGPDAAENVVIEDIVPDGYTYVAGSIMGGDVNSDASPAGSGLRWLFNSLASGDSETVTFQATINASGATLNTATVTHDSIDEDLTNNEDTADIVPAVPGMDATKSLDSLIDNMDGTFTASFTVRVTNTGNEPIAGLQIADPLATFPNDFPSGSVGSVTGGDLTTGPYNGSTNPSILTGADVLAVMSTRFVSFSVTFTPDNTAPYCNTAVITGTGQLSGDLLNIDSDDPATPAVDDCTQVIPELKPGVTLDKAFQSTMDNGDGSFTSTFTVTIENTGNEVLTGVALTEDLGDFPPGATFTTSAVPATLAVGQVEVITVNVTYIPNSVGPYVNVATVDGDGQLSGESVNAGDKEPVTPPLKPSVDIDKVLTSLVDNGGGQFTAAFDIVVTNDGNEPLVGLTVADSLAGFPAGATITGTLPSGVNLGVGDSITVPVTVVFNLDSNVPYSNSATVKAGGEYTGDTVGDTDVEPVEPTIVPAIDVVKTAGVTTSNPDGSFTTTFSITATNIGNEPLSGVNITDDLSGFPPGATIAGTLTTGASLPIGGDVTDNISITYTPNGPGPFTNTALAAGTGDFSSQSANDTSAAVPVTPPFDAAVSVAKVLDGISDNMDGTFTATFTLTATNTGNEPLSNLQITDSLSGFPSGSTGTSSLNAGYNGVGNINTLPGSGTLPVGGSQSVVVTAQFTPDGNQPYFNSADVTAAGSFTGDPESATSNEVEVNPPLDPEISLTKSLGMVTSNGNGSFTVVFDITATNEGNEPLESVQISDPLGSFPGATGISVSSTDFSAVYNPTFGTLLAGTDSLGIGATGTVTLEFTFTPDSAGPFNNQATTTSTGFASGDPGTAASNIVPVIPPFAPELSVTKTLQSVTSNGGGSFTAVFQVEAENTGNEPLTGVTLVDDLSGFPVGATVTGALPSGVSLAVGETATATVTVVFTADGSSPYTNTVNGVSQGEYSTTSAPGSGSDDVTPPFDPQIEITKDVRTVTVAPGNLVTSVIDILVTNTGNEPLTNISIIDDLQAAPNNYPAASGAIASIVAPDATHNASFTGQAPNTEMLAPGQTLAIGESKLITIEIVFTGVEGQTVYLNQATSSGIGEYSAGVETEVSDNPDTPGADNDPTNSTPPFEPELEITKALSGVTTAADGTVTASFTLTIENLGSEVVDDIQITEDLAGFPAGATIHIN